MLWAATEDILVEHSGPATCDILSSRPPRKIEERSLESPPPACLRNIEKFENLFMILRKNEVRM